MKYRMSCPCSGQTANFFNISLNVCQQKKVRLVVLEPIKVRLRSNTTWRSQALSYQNPAFPGFVLRIPSRNRILSQTTWFCLKEWLVSIRKSSREVQLMAFRFSLRLSTSPQRLAWFIWHEVNANSHIRHTFWEDLARNRPLNRALLLLLRQSYFWELVLVWAAFCCPVTLNWVAKVGRTYPSKILFFLLRKIWEHTFGTCSLWAASLLSSNS